MAIGKPTQDFVPIKEVREGVVILKDGGLRAVLLATSVNLSLKSADEQMAIIMQFQNFLNSLEFSTQIVVQSRRRDMRPYLATLEERMKQQIEPLLKIQTKEYIEFIREFTDQTNIMEKNFFVVVPYTPTTLGPNKKASSLLPSFGKKSKTTEAEDNTMKFEEERSQLEQRIAVISQGLSRIGVRTAQLGTEEVIELFYKIFNPGETEKPIKVS
jgi:type IV secretory pathway VirB4 component